MRRIILAVCAAIVAAGTIGSSQSPSPSPPETPGTTPLRVRMHETPTEATFNGLREQPVVPLDVDTAGVENPLRDYWALDPDTGAYYRRDEVLVQFKEGASDTVKAQALRSAGGRRITRVLPNRWEVVALDSEREAADAVGLFGVDRDVDAVSLNYRATTQQVRPNDEFYRLQWNFDAINLPAAWQINPGARNDVVVAVVDTGLNTVTDTFLFTSRYGRFAVRFAQVPDLVDDARIVRPYDFVYDDEYPLDLGGHGTHVAGTIAQQTGNSIGVAGVAYNVRLMPLKVISGGSYGSWDDIFAPGNRAGSDAVIASAIRYAAENGAHVINLSLGGPGPAPVIRDAIRYAVDKGLFVAIAAGNEGANGNPTGYPAAYGQEIDGAMTVGAVNRGLHRSIYSSYKPYVEVCAPGGETHDELDYEGGITQVTYDNDYTFYRASSLQRLLLLRFGFRPRFDAFEIVPLQGTSMATPHVSGMAALLYSQGIRDPRAIEEAIKRFARPIDARADECGAGLIDPRRALRGLGLAR